MQWPLIADSYFVGFSVSGTEYSPSIVASLAILVLRSSVGALTRISLVYLERRRSAGDRKTNRTKENTTGQPVASVIESFLLVFVSKGPATLVKF